VTTHVVPKRLTSTWRERKKERERENKPVSLDKVVMEEVDGARISAIRAEELEGVVLLGLEEF
jgi:hypothetical protein